MVISDDTMMNGCTPDTRVLRLLVLGSTGSIGTQALDVARKNPARLEVVGLAAGHNTSLLCKQAHAFGVSNLALGGASPDDKGALEALRASANAGGFVGLGPDAVLRLIEESDPDIVVNALSGAKGLKASMATLQAGRRLALANKESLVVGGDLIMPLAHALDSTYPVLGESAEFRPQGALVPIDSEHGAIFQCLLGENMAEVETVWVTASGGPFRGRTLSQLSDVCASDALAHPTWNMGAKITIDSSTLMNKGLEVIEAHHLFGAPYDRIEVVVQPQSAIHSMVEFTDGSVKAHLGTTDMRIPIQFALSYPERWDTPVKRMDFRKLGSLAFEAPDLKTFRCLALARAAGCASGTMPAAMNAANEVAVAAFLEGSCRWTDIADTVEAVMDAHEVSPVVSLDQLEEVDARSREAARAYLSRR